MVFWYSGILVFWLKAANVDSSNYLYLELRFQSPGSSLFSTRANKFAPPTGSSITGTLFHFIPILIINLCDLRVLCERQFSLVLWFSGILVFWSRAAKVDSSNYLELRFQSP
jgi:hypothetical protein